MILNNSNILKFENLSNDVLTGSCHDVVDQTRCAAVHCVHCHQL